jgi:hypothetical protein
MDPDPTVDTNANFKGKLMCRGRFSEFHQDGIVGSHEFTCQSQGYLHLSGHTLLFGLEFTKQTFLSHPILAHHDGLCRITIRSRIGLARQEGIHKGRHLQDTSIQEVPRGQLGFVPFGGTIKFQMMQKGPMRCSNVDSV